MGLVDRSSPKTQRSGYEPVGTKQPSTSGLSFLLRPVRTGCLVPTSKTVMLCESLLHSTCAGSAVAPAPRPEHLLHLELRRLREVRLHEHDFMLYNGGHADSKDRVGENHGVRGAYRSLCPTPRGWRLSGDEWADCPTDCDVCIEQLLIKYAACLLGCPKRLQHSVPAVSTVTRCVVTVAWVSSCSF